MNYCFWCQISLNKWRVAILILQATAVITLNKNKKEELQVCGIMFTANQHILIKVFTILKATHLSIQ